MTADQSRATLSARTFFLCRQQNCDWLRDLFIAQPVVEPYERELQGNCVTHGREDPVSP
jgi:hypothetical protein